MYIKKDINKISEEKKEEWKYNSIKIGYSFFKL